MSTEVILAGLILCLTSCFPPKKEYPPLFKAADIHGTTWDGEQYNLFDSKAQYTILYFLDVDCNHCMDQTPEIEKAYADFAEDNSLGLVGVSLFPDKSERFFGYIQKQGLKGTYISPENSFTFRNHYDANATPLVFIIDSNRNVIIERLKTAGQLEEHLEQLF